MNVRDQLAHTIVALLKDDDRRVVLGEDVADGTMIGLSRAAIAAPDVRARVLSTPLTPASTAAYAGGLALGGRRPIVLLSSLLALVEGLAGLREIARLVDKSGRATACPVLFVAPCGPGFGLGVDAVEAPESLLAHLAGVRLVSVGLAHEAPALLRAAGEFWAGEEPTVLLIPRRILLQTIAADTHVDELKRPFAAPTTLREGRSATVFAWGETLEVCMAALEHSPHDARLVNVECLAPLDRAKLIAEAQATGKLAIVHAGPRAYGLGAELAAIFADEAILHLDAPVVRVTGSGGPLSADAEHLAVPSVADVLDAIDRVATF
jgi:pyruvate/2-oxoglutarate/acetoin dehydrogenase E1 component